MPPPMPLEIRESKRDKKPNSTHTHTHTGDRRGLEAQGPLPVTADLLAVDQRLSKKALSATMMLLLDEVLQGLRSGYQRGFVCVRERGEENCERIVVFWERELSGACFFSFLLVERELL